MSNHLELHTTMSHNSFYKLSSEIDLGDLVSARELAGSKESANSYLPRSHVIHVPPVSQVTDRANIEATEAAIKRTLFGDTAISGTSGRGYKSTAQRIQPPPLTHMSQSHTGPPIATRPPARSVWSPDGTRQGTNNNQTANLSYLQTLIHWISQYYNRFIAQIKQCALPGVSA